MPDYIDETIQTEEQNATKETADENIRELRKEAEESIDDDVVRPPSKSDGLVAASTTTNSKDNVKKEPPEMNIQLQH